MIAPGPKSAGITPATRPTIGRMPSYEPVDLSAACNAGVEVLGDEPGDVPLGRVGLRGLPFLIGPEPPSAEQCFLLPGAPMSVGIGRLARRVIVAHRLLEPGAPAGHAVGQIVAEYAFHLAGGEVVVARIRERFEIQVVPPGWGRLPFHAVTDTSDHNLPRFEGSWGEAGARLAEHAMGWPTGYYLWCWENPHPDRPVERIEFIPRGGRFLVAGITTSDVDENGTDLSPRMIQEARRRCQGRGRFLVADLAEPLPVEPTSLDGTHDSGHREGLTLRASNSPHTGGKSSASHRRRLPACRNSSTGPDRPFAGFRSFVPATLRIRPRITGSARPPQPRVQIPWRDDSFAGVFPAPLRYDSFRDAPVRAHT